MEINQTQTDLVSDLLASLPFVKWDRFTVDEEENDYIFYGWIDREQDAYKDFVVLKIWLPDWEDRVEVLSFVTSSAKYSQQISDLLFGESETHNECQRVEDTFKNTNVVQLKNR